MGEHWKPRILIVGAGSVGVILGYHLSLAEAEVTFLIRPHRARALDRPQILHCYDDNKLKVFKGYSYNTDPAEMTDTAFDYIVITLDGTSLQNEDGQSLVETIGKAARDGQVAIGVFIVHVYPTKALSLPLHAPTDPDLIAKADLAYTDRADQALSLDDSFSPATDGFSKIYNRCKVSQCGVGPGLEWNLRALPMFAVFAACELMNWPAFKEIGGKEEPWSLAVAAMKEILGLSVHGEAGQEAARATTEAGLGVWLASWEEQMLPLDWQAFDRYQHGNKVNAQNRALLHACLVSGKAEGKSMSALEELLQRVEGRRGIAVYESGRFSSSTAFGGLAVPGID